MQRLHRRISSFHFPKVLWISATQESNRTQELPSHNSHSMHGMRKWHTGYLHSIRSHVRLNSLHMQQMHWMYPVLYNSGRKLHSLQSSVLHRGSVPYLHLPILHSPHPVLQHPSMWHLQSLQFVPMTNDLRMQTEVYNIASQETSRLHTQFPDECLFSFSKSS